MLKEKWRRTYKNYLIFEVFSLKKILCLICSFLFLTGCSSFENQIIEVSKTVSPSVIRIEASMKTANPSGELNEALSIGSGVIYKTYGVTSNKKIQLNKRHPTKSKLMMKNFLKLFQITLRFRKTKLQNRNYQISYYQ